MEDVKNTLKINEAKDYLKTYAEAIAKVKQYEQLLEYARADLENPKVTIGGKECYSGGKTNQVSDVVATPVLRVLDIESELDELLQELNQRLEQLNAIISRMPMTAGKTYIIAIYLLLKPIKLVRFDANKGKRQFYTELNKALIDFYDVWKQKETKRN